MSCGGDLAEVYLGPSIADKIERVYEGSTIVFERGSALDPIIQALLTQAAIDGNTAFSGDTLNAYNLFFTTIRANGILAKLDFFYGWANNGDAAFASYDMLNPSTRSATRVSSPVYEVNRGFTSDGANSYLDLNYNPAVDGVNYQLNTCSLFVYARTATAKTTQVEGGVSVGGNIITHSIDLNQGSIDGIYRLNQPNAGLFSAAETNPGFYHANRTNGTIGGFELFYNGATSITTNGNSTNGLPNGNIYALALNSNGNPVAFTTRQQSIIGGGGDLSGTDAVNLNAAINTLLTTIGAAV